MSVITYTAKREIEKNSFSAAGTDISADTTDDSFNATSTDLSGGADDEWNEVAGFTDTANNGWFQNNGIPIATKIIQDTGNLVTEAAGNNITIQGYKRGSGQSYDIEFGARVATRSTRIYSKPHRSIGGQLETLLHRHEVQWQITTSNLTDTELEQFREFLYSVEGGESFTFDRDGTIAVPDNAITCTLASRDWREQQATYNKTRIGFLIARLS